MAQVTTPSTRQTRTRKPRAATRAESVPAEPVEAPPAPVTLTASPTAEALLETLRLRAIEDWFEWRDAHPNVEHEAEESGTAIIDLTDASAAELTDEQLHKLVALPEVWTHKTAELGDDNTVRGLIRMAVSDALTGPIEAIGASAALLLMHRALRVARQHWTAWRAEHPDVPAPDETLDPDEFMAAVEAALDAGTATLSPEERLTVEVDPAFRATHVEVAAVSLEDAFEITLEAWLHERLAPAWRPTPGLPAAAV